MAKSPSPDKSKLDRVVAEARRRSDEREATYREQALKLFPHICGRCGREFSGVRLRELTVHHKDHNHDNNPPDGSNWELLCIYCHENEHARFTDEAVRERGPGTEGSVATHNPFADLKKRMEEKKKP
jgi:5-methylcytosine-specific restriction endonuclease McrA